MEPWGTPSTPGEMKRKTHQAETFYMFYLKDN